MKKIVVTGGSGRVGRAVIHDLLQHGYEVLSVDITPPSNWDTPFRHIDLTDYGKAFVALHGSDAVIHLAANPAPDRDLQTGAATFHQNMSSTYNIFNAAAALGLERVVWASSVTVLGFPYERTQLVYAPLDENHPVLPESSYALSKAMGEEMARYFARWSGVTYVGLRFAYVVGSPQVYQDFPKWWDRPHSQRSAALWSYVDVHDVAQTCRLALESVLTGAEVFNIAHTETVMATPSRELLQATWPDVRIADSLTGNNTIFAVDKARRLLGFAPKYSWRDFVQV